MCRKIGAYLRKQLENLVRDNTPACVSCKGKGLMQGIQLSIPLADVTKKALDGASADRCRGNVIRFVPPLLSQKKHVDE